MLRCGVLGGARRFGAHKGRKGAGHIVAPAAYKLFCKVSIGDCFSTGDKLSSAQMSPRYRAPCGLRGCKNRLAPFPGQMSYKATKPGTVSPFS